MVETLDANADAPATGKDEPVKRCRHTDHILMPRSKGMTTTLGRCRECNRDFDSDTPGWPLVAYRDGRYVYASSNKVVP